jgi:hypothetical protein
MRFLALVFFLFVFPCCVSQNTFSGEDNVDYSAEDEAAELLTKGKPGEAEKLLRRHVGVTVRESLEIGDVQALHIAVASASEKEIERTIPLLATAYAEKQKVGVGDFVKSMGDSSSDSKGPDTMMSALFNTLPSDPLAGEEDIRKARDLTQALVATKANATPPVALSCLIFSLADFGNRMNKFKQGQTPTKQDIDGVYGDLEMAIAIATKMKEEGSEKAGKIADSLQKIYGDLSSADGADKYEKFGNYLRKK